MTENNIGIDIKSLLGSTAEQVEGILSKAFGSRIGLEAKVAEAMEYSLLGGGKRLRAAIVLWSCELICGEVNDNARRAAAAIEMVHAYSLIHDDLPAMDDDDFRRGRPSSHKQFDEATAILAGDGLLTMAFEILAESKPGDIAAKMVLELSQACGGAGMIAGQMADMLCEKQTPTLEMLEYIHINKTAKMFRAANVLGAIAGGGNGEQVDALGEFGLKMGLSFQIADDILDVSVSSEQLGKTAGKDADAGKMTYPALMGVEKSKQIEKKLADEAIGCLWIFGDKAECLRELIKLLLDRQK